MCVTRVVLCVCYKSGFMCVCVCVKCEFTVFYGASFSCRESWRESVREYLYHEQLDFLAFKYCPLHTGVAV